MPDSRARVVGDVHEVPQPNGALAVEIGLRGDGVHGAKFTDPKGTVILDTNVIGGGITGSGGGGGSSGPGRPLLVKTLILSTGGAHPIGDSGPIKATGTRYLTVGASFSQDPAVNTSGMFIFEMLAPDNVTWIPIATGLPRPRWPTPSSDQQSMGVDSGNYPVLIINDVRLRWIQPWTGSYWVLGAS